MQLQTRGTTWWDLDAFSGLKGEGSVVVNLRISVFPL